MDIDQGRSMYDNTRVYTDIQSVKSLQGEYTKNPNAVKKEVAQQFEALMMQMVMHSMRDANKAFSSGLLGNDQMDLYQDLFDKQLSLMMSGGAFSAMIEKNLDQQDGTVNDKAAKLTVKMDNVAFPVQGAVAKGEPGAVMPAVSAIKSEPEPGFFATQEDFIRKLWPAAKFAAKLIGANPEVLLAQAALETNWGKNILSATNSVSTYNLFNIKSGSNWQSKTVSVDTLEQNNGVLSKEKANFRSYESFMDSFMDYVKLLKHNDRYTGAVNHAYDPHAFAHALQNAGYATDQNYADKILKIFHSKTFKNIIEKVGFGP